MKRRKFLLITLICLGLAVVLAAFNYWTIVGWLRQESFYEGRPTSYWEAELRQWKPEYAWNFNTPRWWAREDDGLLARVKSIVGVDTMTCKEYGTFPLLEGDPAAEPVLRELLSSSSKDVQKNAKLGLDSIRRKSGMEQ